MRIQFLISLLILFVAALAIVFWLRPKQRTVTLQPTQKLIQPTNEIAIKSSSIQNSAISHEPTKSYVPSAFTLAQTNPLQQREIFNQVIEQKNSPIEFYGQVIDQDGNALSGADIKALVRHWTTPDPLDLIVGSKEIPLEQKSGADGRFELTGATGDAFGVGITKDGYELEQDHRSFSAVGGSFENPVIFKMWSTNIHEKLISGGKSFDIVPDGRPYFINLRDDTISESAEGDLKVWIQYTNQPVRGQLYDWSAGIEVINGGLLEEGIGSAMYEAPTDGYVPSFQLSGQIKGGQRGDIGERQFYLKLKNGQEYGQMSIGLYAPFNDQTPGLIRLSYAINPAGSRILR